MKCKLLKLIVVLSAFGFSQAVEARETLIRSTDGSLDKIVTDFKGTRVYHNGNLVYSSDVDSHEKTMNRILKGGGALMSDNKSYSFSISGRVPSISPKATLGTTSTSGSTAASSASGSAPESDLASPSSPAPASSPGLVPDFTSGDNE
ncbi:MAG: hypothetical protein ACU837_14040 [Gammaproteobacteria bacterium]